jgi:glycosyltransferase involved in cell wall biosynthesis
LGRSDLPGLEEALRDWITFLNGQNRVYELILVDDALLDRTAELAEHYPSIRVLRDPIKRGPGAALRLGLAAAQHPLFFYARCDGCYQPKDVMLLLDEIDKTDVVTGHRIGRRVPLALRCLGFAWRGLFRVVFGLPLEPLPAWLGWRDYGRNLFARIVFALRLHDVQCDFRLFRRSVFRRIPIQSNGPFVHVEVLAKANFVTALMTDVPVSYRPMEAPASWWKEAWHIFAHPDFGLAVLPKEMPIAEVQEKSPPPNDKPESSQNGPAKGVE